MAFEGETLPGESRLLSGSLILRSLSTGDIFSFMGDIEPPVNLSITSPITISGRASEPLPGSICKAWDKVSPCAAEILAAVGVLAGDDFVGEIDLARSVVLMVSLVLKAR